MNHSLQLSRSNGDASLQIETKGKDPPQLERYPTNLAPLGFHGELERVTSVWFYPATRPDELCLFMKTPRK